MRNVGFPSLYSLQLRVRVDDVAPDNAVELRRLAPVVGIALQNDLTSMSHAVSRNGPVPAEFRR